ncbi:ribA/ribD-like protein [Frankia torreyi]|uniref:RibA/ribD-like protein n=1 Tax=Frankia torreyi TaxID=1856 RepID=A0A0D8B5Q0_9ACTN|nr:MULTISPECIES: NADAR family protein [unclassified Frankia]KJE19628.1 ribA/ribD-like protein [Frankia torreyi]KQC34743.1 hypothetical protein UK82_30400 [Frankia sp. ACN1ag]KQM01794.1 hypothetical protein FF86_11077 [Frankia sp. CpI1-P]
MLSTSGPPRSIEDLRRLEHQAAPLRFRYFWGQRQAVADGTGAGCLSLRWPARFAVDGVDYPSAQHYVLARKAGLFGDQAAAEAVLALPAPISLAAIGRRIRGFDEAVWDRHRYAVALAANSAKFAQNAILRTYLAGTAGLVLADISPRDRVWGIGCDRDDDRAGRPSAWPGRNLLGFALMEVRDALLAAAAAR